MLLRFIGEEYSVMKIKYNIVILGKFEIYEMSDFWVEDDKVSFFFLVLDEGMIEKLFENVKDV